MTSVVPLFFLNLTMNMKAKYGKDVIYIKYVSSDKKYALVSKEKVGKRKVFIRCSSNSEIHYTI